MTDSVKNFENQGPIKIPNLKDNFGLTRSEFNLYLEKLDQGDETLFTKVFKVHFHDSVKHLSFKFNITLEEAYDACMDTMLEFREKLLERKIQYGNLRYLFTKMAIHNHIMGLRKLNKVDDAIDVFTRQYDLEHIDKELFFNTLDESIEELSTKNKELINKAYFFNIDLAEYAKRNGLNYATLRKQKQRSLDKLKSTFFQILKSKTLK